MRKVSIIGIRFIRFIRFIHSRVHPCYPQKLNESFTIIHIVSTNNPILADWLSDSPLAVVDASLDFVFELHIRIAEALAVVVWRAIVLCV